MEYDRRGILILPESRLAMGFHPMSALENCPHSRMHQWAVRIHAICPMWMRLAQWTHGSLQMESKSTGEDERQDKTEDKIRTKVLFLPSEKTEKWQTIASRKRFSI